MLAQMTDEYFARNPDPFQQGISLESFYNFYS